MTQVDPSTSRATRHYSLSTQLSFLSDKALLKMLNSAPATRGWGQNHEILISDEKTFVKRIPITALEAENRYSTRNVFRIPVYYNYGVGSAGFGAFRELATQIKTTNWVLAGDETGFPLMHHYRIVRRPPQPVTIDQEQLSGYLAYWNNSKPVGRYMLARAQAPYELILCLEHIDYSLEHWLASHPRDLQKMIDSALNIVRFLHAQGVIHFDAHVQNMLTDGSGILLCDYGLALDGAFELSARERKFFEAHRYYDYGQVISGVGYGALPAYNALDNSVKAVVQKKLGVADTDFRGFARALSKHASRLADTGIVRFEPEFLEINDRYQSVIQLMLDFYSKLSVNKRKNTPFPTRALTLRLSKLGVI